MITREAINNAIAAHGKWKTRLRQAIEKGDIEFDIEKAGTDNNCDFGKWLYSESISPEEKKTDYYNRVKTLHAEFHRSIQAAANLLSTGKKAEALQTVNDLNGVFNKISVSLVLLLSEWRDSLFGRE